MSSSNKRKLPADHQGQSERKRAKIIEKQQQQTGPPPASTNSALSTVSATKTATTNGPPSFLPSPPDLKREEFEMPDPPTPVEDASDARVQSIKNVIQTQLGLEILLKHKELRLIDQEIAKCQVSLEQLRRCKEIPFPGTQHLSLSISNGSGAALRTSFPTPLPPSPAPWGVVEGPYSRHFAKWLLPDSRFDGGEPDPINIIPAGKSPMKSRSSTRGSFIEPLTSSQSRAQRGGNLKALPAGYGQPKEKATGPMIVKRKSDGLSVKLVCPDCGRFDFGSAQGFINHCRIGHGRSFASHDAAADACGEPVEVDESGAMIGVEPVQTPTGGNVHPLIRSAKLLQPAPPRSSAQLSSEIGTSQIFKPKVSPDFKASILTPNLSELVKSRGLGIDLQEMVTDAKTKMEMSESDSEEDEVDVDIPMQNTAHGRHPQVAGTKQPSKPTKSPMSSPLLSTSMLRSPTPLRRGGADAGDEGPSRFDGSNDSFVHHRPRGITLPVNQTPPTQLHPSDPSPTSETNQAPSLVDDDEDYEAHSPTSTNVSEEHDVGEVDFEVQGDDDDARSVLRGPDFQPNCAQTARPSPHVRRPSAIRRQGEDREEKHVSFVSPSPARDMPASRIGGERKRRKA